MTKVEHTHGYTVADYTKAIEKYLGGAVDTVVYNNTTPDASVLKRYAREGDTLTSWQDLPKDRNLVGADLVAKRMIKIASKIGTPAKESSLVRHDSARLAAVVAKILKIKPRTR
jgi:2-phospho-L-lactate transferase/gluconeogenesis factor (CofD/UPF0052 family)